MTPCPHCRPPDPEPLELAAVVPRPMLRAMLARLRDGLPDDVVVRFKRQLGRVAEMRVNPPDIVVRRGP